jgi:hypothetical protein
VVPADVLAVCGKSIVELYVQARLVLLETKLGDFDDTDVLQKITV